MIKGMYIQAGTIKTQKPGASIYGGEFSDESFAVKHTEVGLLGMCKRSGVKHSNESQFYVTTGAPLNFLDGEHVVFGRVIEGMDNLREIESMECHESTNEKPKQRVRIVSCGEFRA